MSYQFLEDEFTEQHGGNEIIGDGDSVLCDTTKGSSVSFPSNIQQLINQSRQEGHFGESVRGIGVIPSERRNVDLKDYKPVQGFPLNELPINIITLRHDLAKNIIGIQFEQRVTIYNISRDHSDGEQYFSFTKIQELTLPQGQGKTTTTAGISSFSINSNSHVAEFGNRRLVYALSLEDDSKFYLVSEVKTGKEPFSHVMTLDSKDVRPIDGECGTVRHLSFDADHGELLASLTDECICVVWDVGTLGEVCRFVLKSPGVACLWHKSEPYKLLVVEQGGLLRMYNTLKQTTIFTINTLVQPIYSADWSPTNSELVGIGANNCSSTFDLSLLNSEAGGKRLETHAGATHCLKFSTTDSQQFATATMGPRPEIKAYQHNFKNSIWTSKQESIQSIAWIYGEPFLMALAGKQLYIFESNLV